MALIPKNNNVDFNIDLLLHVNLTGTCGQDTQHPPFFSFFFHFHGLEICKTAIICRFLIA